MKLAESRGVTTSMDGVRAFVDRGPGWSRARVTCFPVREVSAQPDAVAFHGYLVLRLRNDHREARRSDSRSSFETAKARRRRPSSNVSTSPWEVPLSAPVLAR